MDRSLINYFPEVLKEVRELKAIVEAEEPEIVNLWTALKNALNDQFVNDATENGVSRLEKILKITPKATDTLDVRKFRILTRYNEQLPYTYRTLEQQLVTLCGENGYSIQLNSNEYTLKVRVELSAKGKFDEVNNLLHRIVPANMIIDLSLLYNQHSTLANFTHSQLSTFTQEQLRNEVII